MVHLSERDMRRLHLLGDCAEKYFDGQAWAERPGYGGLTLRQLNVTNEIVGEVHSHNGYLAAAAAMLPTAYGGIHLVALTVMFPTVAEKFLWELACSYLLAIAGGFVALCLINYLINKFFNFSLSGLFHEDPDSRLGSWLYRSAFGEGFILTAELLIIPSYFLAHFTSLSSPSYRFVTFRLGYIKRQISTSWITFPIFN
jgi:hypothetical protein